MIAALVGTIATAIAFVVAPEAAAPAYLVAWAFAMSIALGALVLLAIGHATAARWTTHYQAGAERIASAIPVLAILFVPIALTVYVLYPWTDLSVYHGEALAKMLHKQRWLSVPFWCVRAGIYLAVWIVVGELLVRTRSRKLAAAALPILGLTLTFAAFDWLMSLSPLWYSTIYGLIYWAGGFVAVLGVLALVVRAPAAATSALARLLFAMLVFWAYIEFAQGVIIWLANKPDEVPWYVARGAGGWGGVFAFLAVGGFVVPLFALMPRAVKSRPRYVAALGGWLALCHLVDMAFLVLPPVHWTLLAAPVGVCGVAWAFAARRRLPPVVVVPYEVRS